jgi:glycosyltransferase involved in cell wall biosynthesis
MRIVHVVPTYFHEDSIIGGGERYVHELARAQEACPGLSASVISFGRSSHSLVADGVSYRIFEAAHWKHFTQTNPFAVGHALALQRADVVHVHQLCTFVSDMAALSARLFRIPVVGTDHGGGGAWVLNRRLPVDSAYRLVIGQSRMAAELLEARFDDRVVCIPGGVDAKKFTPAPAGGGDRREILFVGRLLPHKGVHTLLEAFRRFNRGGWRLRIVGRRGDEAYWRRLQEMAAGLPVSFETDVDDAGVIDAYQTACVTVIASVGGGGAEPPPELMGFTVLESQACGTPVICSDDGPMREFIREGETGWVFPAGDAEALARCLDSAADAWQAPGRGIADRCREAVQPFIWKGVVSAHRALYQSVLRGASEERRSR